MSTIIVSILVFFTIIFLGKGITWLLYWASKKSNDKMLADLMINLDGRS